MKQTVIIASKNPVKINSVRLGFEKMFPKSNFEFEGASIPSEVSDQPMTNEETLTGAINRTKNARVKFPAAHFWVGIEGGIERMGTEMSTFAWVVIASKTKKGKAKTAAFFLPPKVVKLINEGMELGEADDVVFGQSNSKQTVGASGILTKNLIDRTSLYVPAVIFALIPFANLDLY